MVLSSVKWKYAIVYIDDIIIFSNNIDEHLGHPEHVLTLLKEAGLSLKLTKCFFMHEEIEYLGHIVKPREFHVARKTVEAIQRLEHPTNKTEMRSFLGMCNVYRRFVKDFASIARPLNKLLRKTLPDEFGKLNEEETKSFETLQTNLANPPVLALPRSDLPYVLDTDANANQLGAVLMQQQADKSLKPVGYFSKTLTDTEVNCDTTERECLAIIWAVTLLRPYLEGTGFTLRMYQDPLKWLFGPSVKSAKLARWRLRLQDFEFTVEFLPGIKNLAADVMSRLKTSGGDQRKGKVDVEIPTFLLEEDINPYTPDEDQLGISEDALRDATEPSITITIEELQNAQQQDNEFIAYARTIGMPKSLFDFNEKVTLVRRSQLDGAIQKVVPEKLRERVHLSHDPITQGHPGESRLYQTLRQNYSWPFMAGDALHHVKTCRSCVKEKGLKAKKQHNTKLFPPTGPLDDIAVDILGPLPKTKNGTQFILGITDRYSKLTRAIPMSKISAPYVAAAILNNWILPYGIPNTILSDNGSQFIAEFFKTIYYILGIERKTTTSYHPKTNGQFERYNRTIAARLRHYVSEHQNNWDQFVQPLTYAYNAQVHRSTGKTPFNLTITRPPPCPIVDKISTAAPPDMEGPPSSRTMQARILRRLRVMFDEADSKSAKARVTYKRYADRTIRQEPNFKTNDSVFLLRPPTEAKSIQEKEEEKAQPKLRSKMTGPFKVTKANADTVTIEQDGLPITVSIDRCAKNPGTTNEQEKNPLQVQVEQESDDGKPHDESEIIVQGEPDPETHPIATASRLSKILRHQTDAVGNTTYSALCEDGTYRINITPHEIPKPIIGDYSRDLRSLTQLHPTVRRRGRPRINKPTTHQRPMTFQLQLPQSTSAQPL